MRGANAYRSLNEAHDRIEAEPVLPGTRYEALRDAQRHLDERMQDGANRPGPDQSKDTVEIRLDAIEARLAALDKELSAMRDATRAPEAGAAPQQRTDQDHEPEMDRLFALHNQQGGPQSSAPEPNGPSDYVAPERWTDRGGMVEQQGSAREWHKHILEERQKRAAEHVRPADQMTPEDLSVLNAAREHETQSQQQQDKERVHAQDHPAP
jgi:hypothetical protein